MSTPLSTVYRLRITEDEVSLQPYKRYRNKIIICTLLGLIAFVVAWLWPLSYEMFRLVIAIGCMCLGYAVFDLLFKMNRTLIFDRGKRQVYLKLPGLFSRKLMSFDEVYLLPETTNGELRYVITHKKNKYGKGYAISDYFTDTKKGRREQETYEEEILAVIDGLLKKE